MQRPIRLAKATVERLAQRGDAVRIEAVAGVAAVDLATNQSGFLQDLEVLRHGRLGERHHLHHLATYAAAAARQRAQDLEPRRMSLAP